MKLSDDHIALLRNTIGLEPIDNSNPSIPQLERHFGDHTFYVNKEGLYVWERREDGQAGEEMIVAYRIASWADAANSSLTPRDPVEIDLVIDVSAASPDRNR